jgi:hypothetical protein
LSTCALILSATLHAAKQRGAIAVQQETRAAMWTWTDKYVYQPGESLTLRWTLKTNDDTDSYTLVAFRVNNQTGVRTYLPGGASQPTDAFGQTAEQGFRTIQLTSADKAALIGQGGMISGSALTIPDELGMHTIVVELRDSTGTRVVKTAYAKIGVVSGFEDLQGNIGESRTLENTKAYRLRGVVFVRNNAILTIQPGTFIIGQPGAAPSPSVLVIARTGRINASGTRSRPIIMTSSQPFGQRRRGDWGGLIMLGAASANTPAERSFIEGLPETDDARYGGTDDDHNCGTLRYVRVEYAGAEFAPNNEVNGITWGGCGRSTVAEYLQSHYGFDDAFEWFGGTNSAKHLVATHAGDDGIDTQLGYRGRIQYAVVLQNSERGNRGIEADNSEFVATAEPLGDSSMYNFTIVGSGLAGLDESNSPGVYLRRGAVGTYNNMIVANFASTGVQLDQAPTIANIDGGRVKMNGMLLWNNGRTAESPNTLEGQVHSDILTFAQGTRGQGRNFASVDPKLRRPGEMSDPDLRPDTGSPVFGLNWVLPPDDGFFDQSANFIGAFGDENWTEEWTNFVQEQDIRP